LCPNAGRLLVELELLLAALLLLADAAGCAGAAAEPELA
jgi:hypothetical protein